MKINIRFLIVVMLVALSTMTVSAKDNQECTTFVETHRPAAEMAVGTLSNWFPAIRIIGQPGCAIPHSTIITTSAAVMMTTCAPDTSQFTCNMINGHSIAVDGTPNGITPTSVNIILYAVQTGVGTVSITTQGQTTTYNINVVVGHAIYLPIAKR